MIVVDTSVALQWLLVEPDAEAAEGLIARDERLEARLLTRDAPFARRAGERGYGHLLAEAAS